MFESLKGKTVVVTGGSKGIGKGISRVFANHGANVAIIARNLENAKSCANDLKKENDQVTVVAFQADVTDRKSLDQAVSEIVAAFKGIDVVCANAGIFPSAKLEEMANEEWNHVMDTNVKGTLFTIQACLPFLKRAEFGRVVITSSITGSVTGYAGWTHYAASKAAQIGFMRSAALELAEENITVNAVLPGNVMTEGLEGMGEEYLQDMRAAIPLNKLGKVEDIGYAALFLASEEAGFITGQSIIVDGGQVLPED